MGQEPQELEQKASLLSAFALGCACGALVIFAALYCYFDQYAQAQIYRFKANWYEQPTRVPRGEQ